MYLTAHQADDQSFMLPILKQIFGPNGIGDCQKLTSANAFVYRVGNEYVKFPISMRAEKALRREIGISNFLNSRVSFSVPYFECGQISINCCDDSNLFFAKSQKIRGVPLYQATMRPISHNALVSSLVDVLDELHTIPVEEMRGLKVPSFRARLGKIIAATVQLDKAPTHFKPHVVKKIRSHLGENEKDVLCHRDLHGANLFVNPITGGVTGLLDFGMAELAPPAIEIADVSVYANAGLSASIMRAYQTKTGRCLGDLYLYHAGDRNRWLQKMIVSCAKECHVPLKITAQQILSLNETGRVKQ